MGLRLGRQEIIFLCENYPFEVPKENKVGMDAPKSRNHR